MILPDDIIDHDKSLYEEMKRIRCLELRFDEACGGFYNENGICTRCGIAKHEPYTDPQSVEYWRGVRTKEDVRNEVAREVELLRQTAKIPGLNALPYVGRISRALIDMLVDARWEREKDLSDMSYMVDQVTTVYHHITGGQLSKPNYEASVVIAAADDSNTEWTNIAIEEAAEECAGELETLEEKFSQLHKLASDLCYQDEFGHSRDYFRIVKRLHNFLQDEPNPLPLWRRAGRTLKAILSWLRRNLELVTIDDV